MREKLKKIEDLGATTRRVRVLVKITFSLNKIGKKKFNRLAQQSDDMSDCYM